jgi:hypothetical protein
MLSSTKSRIDRPWARRLSQAVSILPTKWLPSGLIEPYDPFLQSMAFRIDLSAALFVGSTPSTFEKVQRDTSYLGRSEHISAATGAALQDFIKHTVEPDGDFKLP